MEAYAARLEVVAGNAVGMSILVEDELLIGRQAEGAGRLAEDDEISRSHARVTLDSRGVCAIEDLGSTNGTFVNGLRISEPHALFEGDTIELGGTTFIVRDVPGVGAPAAVPVTVLSGIEEPVAPTPTHDAPMPPTREQRGQPPRLSVRFEVDFAGQEALIVIDEAAEPIRLRLDNGEWRIEESSQ